jgi:hypothetical protein
MKGEYLKNCNCVASCPCDTVGVPAPHSFCEGFLGMRIEEGNLDSVKLDGLKWAVLVHFPGALHEGNGTAEVYLDENANSAQRDALVRILTGKEGGELFDIVSQIITTIHGPYFEPIDWDYDYTKRKARVAVRGRFETVSEPLPHVVKEAGQRVLVQIPDGFEYRVMEVAQATVLKSTGDIKFDWSGTNSNFALVEHTDKGLVSPEKTAAATA